MFRWSRTHPFRKENTTLSLRLCPVSTKFRIRRAPTLPIFPDVRPYRPTANFFLPIRLLLLPFSTSFAVPPTEDAATSATANGAASALLGDLQNPIGDPGDVLAGIIHENWDSIFKKGTWKMEKSAQILESKPCLASACFLRTPSTTLLT